MSQSLEYARKFFEFLKGFMMVSLFCLLFYIFCIHFNDLNKICDKFFSAAQAVNLDHLKASVFGVEIEGFFSKELIASQLAAEGVKDPKIQENVRQTILELRPGEVDRLMHVGNLEATCDFSRPTPKTRGYIEIDRLLNMKGLVSIRPDPVTYGLVKKRGEFADHGFVKSCYQMKLTTHGHNVKTALVKTLGTMFEVNAANPRVAMN